MDVKNAQKIREKLAKRLKRPKMVRIPLKTFPKSASIKLWAVSYTHLDVYKRQRQAR